MKKYIVITLIIISSYCNGIKNWKNFTNTSSVNQIKSLNKKTLIATTGGLLIYDSENFELINKITVKDGLEQNYITCLTKNDSTNSIFCGMKNKGVAFFSDNKLITTINNINGLTSNNINNLDFVDSKLYVSTDNGFSIFKLLEGFPFPLALNSFSTNNSPLLSNKIINTLKINDNFIITTPLGISYVNYNNLDVLSEWKTLGNIDFNITNSIFINNKLYVYDEHNITIFSENLKFINSYNTNSFIFKLFENSKNIYASLGKWDNVNLLLENVNDSLLIIDDYNIKKIKSPFDNIQNISSSFNNGFYDIITTWGNNIFVNKENKWQKIAENELLANAISKLHVDDDGNLWVGSGHFSAHQTGLATKGVSKLEKGIWKNYTVKNSIIHSDNITGISNTSNGKLILGSWAVTSISGNWDDGAYIYDFNNDFSQKINNLASNTISNIAKEKFGIWVISYSAGINLLNTKGNIIFDAPLPNNLFTETTNPDPTFITTIDFGESKKYGFIGTFRSGILEFKYQSEIPTKEEIINSIHKFNYFSSPNLKQGKIYDIAKIENDDLNQIYFAHDSGLFMYDGTYWYRFTKTRKRQFYYQGTWNDEFYYDGTEEVIFGANSTIPTALYIDPFKRLWIGTKNQGISMLNLETLLFHNYTKNDFPLLKEEISSFAYDYNSGQLYFATPMGLGSVNIGGKGIKTNKKISSIIAYPNPFNPQKDYKLSIVAKDRALPKGKNYCSIFDSAGDLIIELKENEFNEFSWNGLNSEGKECSSGLYFYIIGDGNGDSHKGKIVLIK